MDEVMVECWREYMIVVIDGLADDLGPELTLRAKQSLGLVMPHEQHDAN